MARTLQSLKCMTGDKELIRALDQLRGASVRKIMRPAISVGLTIIKKEAQRLTKHMSFKTRIAKRIYKPKKGGGLVGMVYVKTTDERFVSWAKAGRPKIDFGFVLSVHEFGSIKTNQAPKPVVTQARQNTKGQVLIAVRAKAKQRLLIEIAKAKARGKFL